MKTHYWGKVIITNGHGPFEIGEMICAVSRVSLGANSDNAWSGLAP